MSKPQSSPSLEHTVPEPASYPTLTSFVDDIERYVSPQRNTRHHTPVNRNTRFYFVDDCVYIGETIARSLAARRNNPLLILDDNTTFPQDFTSTDTPGLYDFLQATQTQEVVISISDATTLPQDALAAFTHLLSTQRFDPSDPELEPFVETPSALDTFDINTDNLVLLLSEPEQSLFDSFDRTIRSHFGVRVDPDKHDGYTDDAFTPL